MIHFRVVHLAMVHALRGAGGRGADGHGSSGKAERGAAGDYGGVVFDRLHSGSPDASVASFESL
jgi:hypothetical protein